MPESIDILENKLLTDKSALLEMLLADHTTQQNIFWATDSYTDLGRGYEWHDAITPQSITGNHEGIIRPRAVKNQDEQQLRSKQMAEVFTPSWLCNRMNNEADAEWFGRPDVFNTMATDHSWQPTKGPIRMPKGKSWYDYVTATRLEITCGEAPFLVSRYDTVTGEPIPLDQRIGILDRKLRIVGENATEEEWPRWALIALGSVYGYEWQGDSLLLAREAVLLSFAEYFQQRFGHPIGYKLLGQAARICSWNLWQMDGLKAVVPDSCHEVKEAIPQFFGDPDLHVTPCPGCSSGDIRKHNGIYCRLRRWIPSSGFMPDHFDCTFLDFITTQYKTFHKNKWPMKFDFVIGNPPYNEDTKGTSDKPVYDKFMDGAYQMSPKVMLITPARFLFNAGKTQKDWNEKMLSDKHLKVLEYKQNSSETFPNTDIKGGVVISYHDTTKDFGKIDVFTKDPQLNNIRLKIEKSERFKSLSSIVYTSESYHFTKKFHESYPNAKQVLSNSHENDVTSNIFIKLPQVFIDENGKKGNDYIKIYGLVNNSRCFKWIRKDYIRPTENLCSWKIFFSKSNGSGIFGEKFAEPIIAEPNAGHTQTFISMGNFKKRSEAEALIKYLKTKFSRTLLGILKVTQDNKKKVWKYVPLQDFTPSSDIDWSKSVHEIDLQLYDKYGLTEDERHFIETHVKAMD